ncbi:MAG TPA: hypothetical protein VGN09_05200 [Vicinamibacteria bacterium]|jgi:hypothetical protein
MRLVRFLSMPALLLITAGCLSSTTLIKVRPDGGGTLVETVTMSPERFNQIAGMRAMLPAGSQGATSEPFSEAEARAKAGRLGQGVSFVASEKIETPRARGLKATYAFTDVTKLRVNEKPSAPAGAASGPARGGDVPEDVAFRFAKQPGGTALLTVVFPKARTPAARPVPSAAPAPLAGPMPAGAGPQQASMIREMFKGLKIDMAVEVEGRLVKTSSPFVDGAVVTLFDLDFDTLLANDAVFKQLQGPVNNSVEEAKKLARNTPGVKVNPDSEVTIEFAAK